MRILIRLGLIFIIAVSLSSCVSSPKCILKAPGSVYQSVPQPYLRGGLYHSVAPGETLWRIGKMFDVPASEIIRANKLKAADIRIGQRLFIPNAAPIKPIITLYPSCRWKYIIVHHSASSQGNATKINSMHLSKGWNGAGYDFIIDNGTKGKQDGQIEPTVRWIKQVPGAHCKASGMNEKGIGICLVGNFDYGRPSAEQMDALVYLVNLLRKNYDIPMNNIIGHGQVRGARTDCPGKKFPWTDFKERLRY